MENNYLQKYLDEFNNDVSLDRMNLEDKQLRLPGIRAKWVGRLINHKKQDYKLQEIRHEAIKESIKNVSATSPVELSESTLSKSAQTSSIVKKIDAEIIDNKLIIEFLEKCERITASITYDIKNIIDILKMESQ